MNVHKTAPAFSALPPSMAVVYAGAWMRKSGAEFTGVILYNPRTFFIGSEFLC
jgi:hypothetical protein